MPEDALRALVTALAVEVNAGVRHASHQLDDDAARARLAAMRAYDEALGLFGDDALTETWRRQSHPPSSHADVDWPRTIGANLRHYQAEHRTVVPETASPASRAGAPISTM